MSKRKKEGPDLDRYLKNGRKRYVTYAQAARIYFGQEYITSLTNLMPMWMCPVLLATCFVFGILGGMIGRKLLKKHFEKAGIA